MCLVRLYGASPKALRYNSPKGRKLSLVLNQNKASNKTLFLQILFVFGWWWWWFKLKMQIKFSGWSLRPKFFLKRLYIRNFNIACPVLLHNLFFKYQFSTRKYINYFKTKFLECIID